MSSARADGGVVDALEAMLTRRSVRAYTDQPVSHEVIEQVIRAAMAAPSAGNQQPWRFVVLRKRERLAAVAAVEPNGGMIAGASVAIVVCVDLRLVRHEGFWVQDCAAATQNLLLAAHALGLGAVWVGTYPREERVQGLKTVLGLPDHVVAFSVVPIGYPAEQPSPADRFDPMRVCTEAYEERP